MNCHNQHHHVSCCAIDSYSLNSDNIDNLQDEVDALQGTLHTKLRQLELAKAEFRAAADTVLHCLQKYREKEEHLTPKDETL